MGKRKEINRKFDEQVERMLDHLAETENVTDTEYQATLGSMGDLIDVKNKYNHDHETRIDNGGKISCTVITTIALLMFETSHVISSKAFSWIPKPKM